MYVIRLKDTEKVYVIREQKRVSAFIGASVGTIKNKLSEYSWEWKEFIIYNPVSVDINTRRGGNPRNLNGNHDIWS